MTQTSIRPAEPRDSAVLLDMITDLASAHGDTARIDVTGLETLALNKSPTCRIFVAEIDQVIGYVALLPLMQLQDGLRGVDIHHLFVMPDFRRKGVARQLIDRVVQHAQNRGYGYVSIGTDRDNKQAQATYDAMGFQLRPKIGPRFRIWP